MSEQDKSSEQQKYSVSIEQAKVIVIGDNARVTNNIFYVHEPQALQPSVGPRTLLTVGREELLRLVRAASNELRDYPNQIAGEHLTRPEATEILEWVVSAGPGDRLGMILDQPGGGKTVVMHDVLEGVEAASIPVLAIKADALSGIGDGDDLARRLGLPMSVEDCARYLAGEGLFIVLLDQIDALSMVLSRDQATLDAVLSSVSRLRDVPNVRLVASCRTFDRRHDPRLSAIKVDREFELRALTEEQVSSVLRRIGVDPARLLPEHKALLTVPLHLHLYAQIIAGSGEAGKESFRTLQELYDALWQRRVEAIPPESPRPEERVEAIYKLVDAMRERSQLTAPVAVLDSHAGAALYLEQIAFIRRERGNYLFTHQMLFDYCYARRFVASGKSLIDEILKGEQGLFERSQMVHVLAYLRGADEHTYRRELTALMFASNLRVHLRLLLTDWFGSLARPTGNELRIAQRLMSTPESCAQFLSSAAGNEDWFDALDSGTMQRLFRDEDQRVANAFYWFLGSAVEKRTREVVSLLRPHLGKGEQWNSRIAFVLDRLTNWESEEALTLLCDLLRERGRNVGREYLLSLHHLASSNPAGGCRALRALLDRRVDEMLEEEKRDQVESEGGGDARETELRSSLRRGRFHWNEYLFGEHSINEILGKAAMDCPRALVEHLLPWFVRITDLLTKKEGESSPADETEREGYAWDALFATGWYGDYLSEGAVLANHIVKALQHVARSQPAEFRRIAEGLARSESLAVHRVLANAYLAASETYIADIVEYLTGDKRRLRLGDMDEPVYDSRCLFGAVFGHAEEEQRSRLEELILNLEPAWEARSSEYDYRGLTQLKFLKSVADADQLSATARLRLAELERRFPDLKLEAPQGMVLREVGSPIDEKALAAMSDDALLDAMRKYDDSYRPAAGEEPFAGGAAELAFAIGGRAEEEPERFYLLTQRFDGSISFRYVLAIISSLARAKGTPAEWVFDLVRRFSSRITADDRKAISSALNERAADNVPDDLLDMMDDWALHDISPAADAWGESDQQGHKRYQGDPFTQGINSTRGIVVEHSCRCALLAAPPRVERAFALLEKAADDPTTAVRSCVVEALNWMLRRGEDDRVLDIFAAATEGHPRILQLPVAHRFLHGSYFRHFKRIRPYVEALLSNEDGNTRQVGASLSCLSAFEYEEAGDLESRAMTGDPMMRRGAAQVYARQLGDPKLESICRDRLLTLMYDDDDDVLASVGVCFAHARPEQFEGLRPFIEKFILSPALLPGAKHLVRYFKQLAADEHELTLNVTERILDEGGDDLFSIRKNRLLTDSELVVLPLTVYTHAQDSATKARAMGIFERLLLKGSYAARQALSDWDRR